MYKICKRTKAEHPMDNGHNHKTRKCDFSQWSNKMKRRLKVISTKNIKISQKRD